MSGSTDQPGASPTSADAALHPLATRRVRLLVALAIGSVGGAFLLTRQLDRWWAHTIDDAAITFSYLETLLSGGGLAIRPGEPHIEAYTNALWLFTLAPFGALGVDLMAAAKIIGSACAVLTASVCFGANVRIGRDHSIAALVGPLLLLGAPLYVFWAVAGLEAPLYGLLLSVIAWRAVADTARWQGRAWGAVGPIAQALLVICRPDGIVYVVLVQGWCALAALLGVLWQRADTRAEAANAEPADADLDGAGVRYGLRHWLRGAVWCAGLYALYFGWHWLYFEEILPNSFRAKDPSQDGVARLMDWQSDGWSYVREAAIKYRVQYPLYAAIAVGLLVPRTARPMTLLVAMLGVGLFFAVYAGGDWMPEWRFIAHFWPIVALIVGLGAVAAAYAIESLLLWPTRRIPVNPRVTAAIVALVMVALEASLVAHAWQRWEPAWQARTKARHGNYWVTYDAVHKRGRFWNEVGERAGLVAARVADVDAGGITWNNPIGFIDLGKLADPSIPRHHPRVEGHVRDYIFGEERPDVFHIHGAWRGAYGMPEMWQWDTDYAPVGGPLRERFAPYADNRIRLDAFTVDGPSAIGSRAIDAGDGLQIARGRLLFDHRPTAAGRLTMQLLGHATGRELPTALIARPCDIPATATATDTDTDADTGTARIPIEWAAGLVDVRRLKRIGWVTGIASGPISRGLRKSPCLEFAVAGRGGADGAVIATSRSTTAPPPAPLLRIVDAWRKRLAADPRALLSRQRSPLSPASARLLCAALDLRAPGRCRDLLWHNDALRTAATASLRTAVEQAKKRLALEPIVFHAGLRTAAWWLVAGREAAGKPRWTELPDDYRSFAKDVSSRLTRAADDQLHAGHIDAKTRELLRLALRVQPTNLRARRLLELNRERMPPPVRSIEGKLRADLLSTPHTIGRALSGADAAAVIASYVRDGELLGAWRCLADGPCSAAKRDADVARWDVWLTAMFTGTPPRHPPPIDREVVGFEGGLDGFVLSGKAFGPGPVRGALVGQNRVHNGEGSARLDSFHGNDKAQGTATGPLFLIEHDFIGMFIGGGDGRSGAKVQLRIGERVVHESGNPKKCETMAVVVWDVRQYRDKTARIVVVDHGSGSWAHVSVDGIAFLR